MRELGQINSKLCKKISVFHYNHKYSIKFEIGDFEQTYKVREGGKVNGMEDIKRLVNDEFVLTVLERFKGMNTDFIRALTGLEGEDEDEFDVIL